VIAMEWLPRARADRKAAIDYIAQSNPRAAVAQLDSMMIQVEMLFQHPELGRGGRKKGTRELVIPQTNFIVVYRIRPRLQRIEIIRVLHASQNWPATKKVAM